MAKRLQTYQAAVVTVVDHEGTVLASGPRLARCRCGASRNKPFCDGSHRDAGFSDPGVPIGSLPPFTVRFDP